MIARRQLGLTMLLFTAALAGAPPPKNAVTGLRFWSLADATRVVIETTDEFEYRWDRVPNPDRLFFDIVDCRMGMGERPIHTIPVGNDLLKQIRMAETQPGVTRIVFDLGAGVEYTASRLINPNRLVVELRKVGDQPPVVSGVAPAEAGAVARAPRTASEVKREPAVDEAAPALPKNTPPVDLAVQLKNRTPLPAPPGSTRSTPDSLGRPAKEAESSATSRVDPPPAQLPAKPAKLGSSSQSMTRVLGLKVGSIVLDPGHGGHDTGTMGPAGLLEKDLVLDICKRLAELIESRLGAKVVLTRTDDAFVPLERRTEIANEQKADLFLSVHANSSPLRSSSGVETFYLNFTSDKAALEVAARENASSQKTVHELKDLVQKIAMQEKIDESRQFAAKIQQSLYSASVRANGRTRNRGVKKAPFVVLIGAAMPSVLAEIGFVSNPRDEALFKKPEFRQKVAEGLYRGLSQYASTLSHFQVARN